MSGYVRSRKFNHKAFRHDTEKLRESIKSEDFILEEVFNKLLNILSKTKVNLMWVFREGYQDYEEIHVMAYDVMGDLLNVLIPLREAVEKLEQTYPDILCEYKYIKCLLIIMDFTKKIWRTFYLKSVDIIVPDSPKDRQKNIYRQIIAMAFSVS